MKKIEVTRYVADDGKEFDTEVACVKYENEILTHRLLISQFEVLDTKLNKVKKPKYLWSNNTDKLNEELDSDPIFISFAFGMFCEDACYVVFKELTNYNTIRESFDLLGCKYGIDLTFPTTIGKVPIVYWSAENDEWIDFGKLLEKSKEVLNTYEYLRKYRGD